MTKDVQKAIYLEQASICQLFFDKGLAIWKDPTAKRSFSNLQFTELYYKQTGQVQITDEYWISLREMDWKFKSNKSNVITKLKNWLLANKEYTLEDINYACEQYLAYCDDENRYPKSLSNFISFTNRETKVKSSELTQWVKYVKEEVELEAIV